MEGPTNFIFPAKKNFLSPGLYGEMVIGNFLLIYNEYRNSDTREP